MAMFRENRDVCRKEVQVAIVVGRNKSSQRAPRLCQSNQTLTKRASEGKGPSKAPATVVPSLSAIVPVLPSPFTWVEAKYAECSDTWVLRLAFPWRSPAGTACLTHKTVTVARLCSSAFLEATVTPSKER